RTFTPSQPPVLTRSRVPESSRCRNSTESRLRRQARTSSRLEMAIRSTPNLANSAKHEFVADIDTIQSQLAKPEPNRTIITSAWEVLKGAAAINGCTALVTKVAGLLAGFL